MAKDCQKIKMPHFPSADLGTGVLGCSEEYLGCSVCYSCLDKDIKGHHVKQYCTNIWWGQSIMCTDWEVPLCCLITVLVSALADLENCLLSAVKKCQVVMIIAVSWLGDQTKTRFSDGKTENNHLWKFPAVEKWRKIAPWSIKNPPSWLILESSV